MIQIQYEKSIEGTFLEVLRVVDSYEDQHYLSWETRWFRPFSWRGTRQAYCIKDGNIEFVPAPSPKPHIGHRVSEFLERWEAVSPDEVLEEKG